jgi:hypothetical protein
LVEEILKFAPGFGPAHLERAKYLSAQGDLEYAVAEAKITLEQAGSRRCSLRLANPTNLPTCAHGRWRDLFHRKIRFFRQRKEQTQLLHHA